MAWRKSWWAKAVFSSSAFSFSSARKKWRYRTPLLLEPLEDRCVPTTITPTTFADGLLGSGSLRDAVLQFNADAGTDDDTIQLEAGTYSLTIQNVGGYHETAGLTGDLNLTRTSHRWIIQGAGPSTIIDASQLQDRVFQIVNPGTQVLFQNLVIQGGLAQDDGSSGALAGTTDALGGGILNNGGTLTLDNVVLQNNLARGGDAVSLGTTGHNARGGGIYSTGGALTMTAATIANNQGIGGRGGDLDYSHPFVHGGSAAGGGLYATGGSLDIASSMVANNRATGGRGGDGYVGTPGSYYGGNGGMSQGGGLYVNGGSLTVTSSTFTSNQAIGGSGGLYGSGNTGAGGGLYVNGSSLTVASSTFTSNQAIGGPGGLYGVGDTGAGGGLYVLGGSDTVVSSTVTSNQAIGGIGSPTFPYDAPGQGGGLYNSGTLTISNSTLSANSAPSDRVYGGGGGIRNDGTLTVSNSTLTGNSVTGSSGSGGGIDNRGTLHARNTIIAGNTAPSAPDLNGNLGSQGHNLIGNTQGGSGFDPTDILNINPLLGPLQDNGGPTKTMALLAGSPAIDAGDNTGAPDWDQRGPGYPRIVNGTIDIGAFEVQPPAQVTHYSVSAPATVVADSAFNVTVKAVSDFGNTIDGYIGTVHFSSSDGQAILPSDYTFTSEDAGVHTFTVTLKTAGAQSITATGTTDGLTGSATGIVVSPAAASTLTLTGVPTSVTAGGPFSLIVTARDPFNNIATGYRSTMTLTSTDSQATLPANYTFTAADAGVHTLSNLILRTAGSRTVTAQDTADGTITGSSTVTVNPAVADHFGVSASGHVTAGTALDLTVTALDAFNNTATSYTRAVSLTSTDASAVLPHDYTFTAADQGVHTFNGVTLKTAGTQTVTATGTRIPADTGILSWWPGDGNANDIVGSNNGTLHGGVTFAEGEVGQAFHFTGPDQYFQSPSNGLPTGNSNRTLELWVNIDSFVAGPAFFAGYGTFGVNGQTYTLATVDSTLFFSQWGMTILGPSLQTGRWYHVAATNVGNSVTLYLNGVAVASGTLPINTPTGSQFYMGSPAGYTYWRLNGLTDEATVYNRALSAAEIRAIYDAGSAGHYVTITGSATVAVSPAEADHLLFLQPPTNTAAGQTITPPVLVAVVDEFGNILTDDNSDTVTLAISTNPSGGTLSGTLTVTVVNGVATFSDLSIDLAGDGYSLEARISGLSSADSDFFNITT
jgi:hypothetical protein